jgi:hypothetical protein
MFYRKKVTQEQFECKIKNIISVNVETVKKDMERNNNILQLQITHLEQENEHLKMGIAKLSKDIHHKNIQIAGLLLTFVGYLGYTNYNDVKF